MNTLFKYKVNTLMFGATLLIITSIIYYYNSRDIMLKIAYNGAGPQNYVAEKLHPENFQKNWEAAGVGKYDFSLPMRIYYYLAKYCGISPNVTVYPFMFIQTLLFLLSVAFLTQTLFQNRFVTFICLIIIPSSCLAGMNLSQFGQYFSSYLSYPLFYGYSNAFRLFAIGFFLRNKYIFCFLFLALSVYCHLTMGLFVLAFIGAYVLYRPMVFRDKAFIVGVMLFLILVAPHIFSIVSNSGASTGGISVDQWVKSTRIFSYHWYPISMKLFTKMANNPFFPLMLICFSLFVALRYQEIRNEKNIKIIVGLFSCFFMSLVGIMFSDIYPVPVLIKLSLQRSTSLVSFFGVLYVIYYLLKKVETGKIFEVVIAIYGLLIFVVSYPGIAVLPLFILLYFDIKEDRFGPIKLKPNTIKTAKILYVIGGLFILLVTLMSIVRYDSRLSTLFPIANTIFDNLWTPLKHFNPFNGRGPDFLVRGGDFRFFPMVARLFLGTILITGVVMGFKIVRNRHLKMVFIGIICVMSLSISLFLRHSSYLKWHDRNSKRYAAYLDVQLWANKNTPRDALFMVDPSGSYGWRDFSERSSFGILREWGYASIAYNPRLGLYQEGLRRMREFGIDIEKIPEEVLDEIDLYGPRKLQPRVRDAFYKMSPERLDKLCKKYGIDYIVMRGNLKPSRHHSLAEKFEIAYRNDEFIVFGCSKEI